MNKIILDLCGGTGAWSKRYKLAGYKVYNITLPKYDLLEEAIVQYCIGLNPYGILCAIDCTIWANSGNQWFKDRSPEEVFYHARLLVHCLRIIYKTNPVFWCIENPVGKMKKFLGKPKLIFDPYEFGDPYTKKTYLWGRFNIPGFFEDKSVEPMFRIDSKGKKYNPLLFHTGGKSERTKRLRSITPEGFAQAFFEANK